MLPLPTVVDLENSQSPNSNHDISTTKVYSMASTCDTNEKTMNNEKNITYSIL